MPSVASWVRLTSQSVEDCSDGVDNDGDELVDGADPDCVCADNDADLFADCVSNPGCSPAELPCGDCNDADPASLPGRARDL